MTVTIVAGTGMWAYWRDRAAGLVIADKLFQPNAPNFGGRLNCVGTPGNTAELAEAGFAVPDPGPSIFSDRFPVNVEMPKEKQ